MSSVAPIVRGAVYRFDRFELLTETEQLRKRGVVVHLAPQSFRLLLLLVSRAGRVVTREEIEAELWGSATFVDFEQGINAAIRRIRFALNDRAETPRFLQTLPRRGYCFVAPVERIEAEEPVVPYRVNAPILPDEADLESEPEAAPRNRFAIVALLAVMLAGLLLSRGPRLAPVPSSAPDKPLRIAIAPASAETRAFHAELRKRLEQLQPERLVLTNFGAPSDLRINTSLRNAADGRHLDVQVIESASGRKLWSDSFPPSKGEPDFPFLTAVRVTRAVVETSLPTRRRPQVIPPHVSPRAWALYREGRALRFRPMPHRDLDGAMEKFEKALTIEPRFAEAWSAVGDVWAERTLFWMGETRRSAVTQARVALDRALAIDPHYAEALNNRGLLLMHFDHSYAPAETMLRKAIAADPTYVDSYVNLALLLSAMGRHEEALASIRHAQVLEPDMYAPSTLFAFFHLAARHFDEAYTEFQAAAAVYPHSVHAKRGMMSAAIATRRWDDAAAALSAMLKEPIVIPHDVPDRGAVLRRHVSRLAPKLEALEGGNQDDPYALACVHAEAGEKDLAFAALDRAIAAQATAVTFTLVDPRLDSLRSDPRFLDRLDKLGFIR